MSEQQMSFKDSMAAKPKPYVTAAPKPVAVVQQEQARCKPCLYDGYTFLSRSEAKWAVFFNEAGIHYEYEPELFADSQHCYKPDFYLPDADTFMEVKWDPAAVNEEARAKMAWLSKALPNKYGARERTTYVFGYSDMRFQMCNHLETAKQGKLVLESKEDSFIAKCPSCGRVFFGSQNLIFTQQCPTCGKFPGDGQTVMMWGDSPLKLQYAVQSRIFCRAVATARSAYFKLASDNVLTKDRPTMPTGKAEPNQATYDDDDEGDMPF